MYLKKIKTTHRVFYIFAVRIIFVLLLRRVWSFRNLGYLLPSSGYTYKRQQMTTNSRPYVKSEILEAKDVKMNEK